MGTDESGTTGDENALTLGGGQQFHRWEARECGIGDGLCIRVVYRLGLVACTLREACMLNVLKLFFTVCVLLCGMHVVGSQIERAQGIEGHLAVETEALEADGGDLLAVLVEGFDLASDSDKIW
jgi:hypothetical protein